MGFEQKTKKLTNGLEYYIEHRPDIETTNCVLVVNVGSADEPEHLSGINHLVEHILFEGSKHYPNQGDIDFAIERYGGKINAAAGKDQTSIFFKIPSAYSRQALAVLGSMLSEQLFNNDEIHLQKDVIGNEVQKRRDSFEFIADRLAFLLLNHPFARPVDGPPEVLERISRDELVGFFQTFYVAANMKLAVVTNEPVQTIEKLIEQSLGSIKPGRANLRVPKEPSWNAEQLIVHNVPIGQTIVRLLFPAPGRMSPKRYALAVLAYLLGGESSSLLFQEVREKLAGVYTISASPLLTNDFGLLFIEGAFNPRQVTRSFEAVARVIRETKDYGFDVKLLEFAQNGVASEVLYALEDPFKAAEWYAGEINDQTYETPEEYEQSVRSVSLEAITALAKELFFGGAVHGIVLGEKVEDKKAELEKILLSL